jgi:hypothetical protein
MQPGSTGPRVQCSINRGMSNFHCLPFSSFFLTFQNYINCILPLPDCYKTWGNYLVRNHGVREGRINCCGWWTIRGLYNSKMAEAMAFKRVLEYLTAQNYKACLKEGTSSLQLLWVKLQTPELLSSILAADA